MSFRLKPMLLLPLYSLVTLAPKPMSLKNMSLSFCLNPMLLSLVFVCYSVFKAYVIK